MTLEARGAIVPVSYYIARSRESIIAIEAEGKNLGLRGLDLSRHVSARANPFPMEDRAGNSAFAEELSAWLKERRQAGAEVLKQGRFLFD